MALVHFCVLPQRLYLVLTLLEFVFPLATGIVGRFGPFVNTDLPSCDG